MFASGKSLVVPSGGYQISRSLRFNSADSASLTRTPATATNQNTWTWSGWIKRGKLGVNAYLFSSGTNASNITLIRFVSSDILRIYTYDTSTPASQYFDTTAVFRDPSAWYHIVGIHDTTQATASDRLKLYVNGVQQTGTTTGAVSQNSNGVVNSTSQHILGPTSDYASQVFDGYMTEVNFIDGQALTPSSFGETNAQTGVWQPKAYSGSYGTNGFYLNFSDNSNTTAATLGKDYSGNGNNWTPNNFSVTAGVGNDSLVDTPTLYGTDTGVGGEVRGNYCTVNAVTKTTNMTLTNGNLDCVSSDSDWSQALGTIGMSSGKWYFEVTKVNAGGGALIGIAGSSVAYSTSTYIYQSPVGYLYYQTGQKYNNNVDSAYGASYTAGDVVGVAFDADAGTLVFYKNGASQGTAFSGLTSGPYLPAILPNNTTGNLTCNFGQRPFAYTAPSGYKALNTQNLPTPTIGATSATQAGKFFNTVLWTGDGTQTRSITGLDFQPDFIWMKIRAGTPQDNQLYDTVRGAGGGKNLSTNTTAPEGTVNSYLDSDYGYLSSFDSNGFSVNDGAVATTGGYVNYSGRTYVAWNWKANGAGSSNTAGTITSTVSASTTSGFSVVTYASTTGTVGHGLGVAPTVIIMKGRNVTDQWAVYHISTGNTYAIPLNSTGAGDVNSAFWNNTTPTSTVFSQGSWDDGYNKVAYCFAPIAGYSAFGSYTGNGSADGPFVYTGFRPAYVMVKRTSSSGTNWQILDTKRSTYNVMGDYLYASASNAEAYDANVGIDSLSNGFKIRGTDGNTNTNSATYIYMAFAENPFKFSLAR